MPLVTRWRRLPISVQWATVCALLVMVIGGLVIALMSFAVSSSASAGARDAAKEARATAKQAQATAKCLNDALGGRAALTNNSALAQRTFAAADQTYNTVIYRLLTSPPARTAAQRTAALAKLTSAESTKAKASSDYYHAMSAVIATASANPLGRC